MAAVAAPSVARADGDRIGRGTLSAVFGVSFPKAEDYTRVISHWGHSGLRFASEVSLDGGAYVTPWMLLGGRLGWFRADAGQASSDDAELTLSMVDFNLIARLGLPMAGPGTQGFVGGTLEVGGALARIELRDVVASRVVPRLGAGVIGQVFIGRFGFGVRLVQRFAWWEDAGGPGVPLNLSSTELAASVEMRL